MRVVHKGLYILVNTSDIYTSTASPLPTRADQVTVHNDIIHVRSGTDAYMDDIIVNCDLVSPSRNGEAVDVYMSDVFGTAADFLHHQLHGHCHHYAF